MTYQGLQHDLPDFLEQVAWETWTPAQWRALFAPDARRAAHTVLLRLATTPTTQDATSLALFYAADAVLPVREPLFLSRFVRRVLESSPRPLPLQAVRPLARFLCTPNRENEQTGYARRDLAALAEQGINTLWHDASPATRLLLSVLRRELATAL